MTKEEIVDEKIGRLTATGRRWAKLVERASSSMFALI